MRTLIVVLLVLLVIVSVPIVVQANPWSAIDSGYAVTTNHHGEEVVPPPDPPLRALVGLLTTNYYYPNGTIRLKKVVVELRDPSTTVVDTAEVLPSAFQPGTSPGGNPIMYAWTGDLEPAIWTIGHYSVKAYFYLHDARDLANAEDLDAMRATTVMTVPELPTGTLGAISILLASLTVYSLRSKKRTVPFRT